MLRFLADESCDFSVVRALRGAGYDVAAVVEHRPGAPDEQVIQLALSESRILLTEDRDFGQLVFAAMRASGGVIYIRFPAPRRVTLPGRVLDLVSRERVYALPYLSPCWAPRARASEIYPREKASLQNVGKT